MKKNYFLWMVIFLIIFFINVSIAYAGEFAGGRGTKNDPYLVATVEQLDKIRKLDFLYGRHYKQIADIDLSSIPNWRPIGGYYYEFNGTFDGNGYKISGINIKKSSEYSISYAGLFGSVRNGRLINIRLENVNIVEEVVIGALVGLNYDGEIIDCYSTGVVQGDTEPVGGLVGCNIGTISNSSSTCIVKGNHTIGGLAGTNSGKITSCNSVVDIRGKNYVGGLVGRNVGTISNSYNTGNVTGQTKIGGLVGENKSGRIQNSYSTGNVSGWYYVGGLVGYNSYSAVITDSYSIGNVRGTGIGGLVGINENSTITKSYSTGSISGSNSAGGLVDTNREGTISLSFSLGDVYGKKEAGGFVAKNSGTITNCCSSGDVTSTWGAGGLAKSNSGTISSSYSTGKVTGRSYSTGGLVGLNYQSSGIYQEIKRGTVVNSYYDKENSGQRDSSKGTPKRTVDMKKQENFSQWDFANVWTIKEGETYPHLNIDRLNQDGAPPGVISYTPADAFKDVPLATKLTITFDEKVLKVSGKITLYEKAGTILETIDVVGNMVTINDTVVTINLNNELKGNTDYYVLIDEGCFQDKSRNNYVGLKDKRVWSFKYNIFSGGTGTEEDPYLVTTAAELSEVRNYRGKHFRQIADIDLSELSWIPIGAIKSKFYGSFDGNGYKIQNLTIDDHSLENIGLFSTINTDGVLKNIQLENVNVKGYSKAGALVGTNFGQVTSSSCTGSITGTGEYIGGLIGSNAYYGRVDNSFSNVNVSGRYYVGGLVGSNANIITNCFSWGDVTGFGIEVGGLVGNNADHGIISNSYYTGNIIASIWPSGCLAGKNDGRVTNSYYNGQLASGQKSSPVYGIAKTIAELKQQASYNGWNFTEIWKVKEGEAFPTLAWVNLQDTAPLAAVSLTPAQGAKEVAPNSEFVMSFDEAVVKGIGNITIYNCYGFPVETIDVTETNVTLNNNLVTFNLENELNAYKEYYILIDEGCFKDKEGNKYLGMDFNNRWTFETGITAPLVTTGEITSITTSTAKIAGQVISGGGANVIDRGFEYKKSIEGEECYSKVKVFAKGLGGFSVDITKLEPDTQYDVRAYAKNYSGITYGDKVSFSTESFFSGGKGTKEDPYLVATAQELACMRKYLDKYFRQTADINLAGIDWEPIGNNQNGFTGSFDGNGYKITGLTIDEPNNSYLGLFGLLDSGGQLNKITLENVNITGGVYVGALVGVNEKGFISNSCSMGTINGVWGSGGLIGINYGWVNDCFYSGNIMGKGIWKGGLVGANSGKVINSYSVSTVNGDYCVGGLVGQEDGEVSSSFYNSEIFKKSDTGKGLAKSTLEMKRQEIYKNWDFSEIWKIREGVVYPQFMWQDFTDTAAPAVISFSPADDLTNVSIDTNLIIEFDEKVVKGSGNIIIMNIEGILVETIDVLSNIVTVKGTNVTINPENDFSGYTEYYVLIDQGCFMDEEGNDFDEIREKNIWNFTTFKTIPKVSTGIVNSITDRTAKITGSMIASGGVEVSEVGIEYKIATQDDNNYSKQALSSTNMGEYIIDLAVLKPNTSYTVRSYAVNAVGTAFGNEVSFITKREKLIINEGEKINEYFTRESDIFAPDYLSVNYGDGSRNTFLHPVSSERVEQNTLQESPNMPYEAEIIPPNRFGGFDTMLNTKVISKYHLEHRYIDNGLFNIEADGYTNMVEVRNAPPTLSSVYQDNFIYNLLEGDALVVPMEIQDPGYDSFTGTVDYDDGGEIQVLEEGKDLRMPFYSCFDEEYYCYPESSDFNWEEESNIFELKHVYKYKGNYTVKVMISDDDGGRAGYELKVNVGNYIPRVIIGSLNYNCLSVELFEGSIFTINGSFIDPGENNWSASVDYGDGTGVQPLNLNTDKTFRLEHVYPSDGYYQVTVKVSDNNGGVGEAFIQVEIKNSNPQISLSIDESMLKKDAIEQNEEENNNSVDEYIISEDGILNGSGLFKDPGKDSWIVFVDYDDTLGFREIPVNEYQTFNFEKAYTDNGVYMVTIRVIDKSGGVGEEQFKAVVKNTNPIVKPGTDTIVKKGVPFTREIYFFDKFSRQWDAEVDLGDGCQKEYKKIVSNFKVNHIFNKSGQFTVKVKINDDDGGIGEGRFNVKVKDYIFNLNIGEDASLLEGSTLKKNVKVYGPKDKVKRAFVDYGDGSNTEDLNLNTDSTFSLTHTFNDDGSYVVKVKLIDIDGDEYEDSFQVTVENVAPVVSQLRNYNIYVNESISGSILFSDPGSDSWTAEIDYGDGSTEELSPQEKSFSFKHTYSSEGNYSASVKINDDDGGSDEETFKVAVRQRGGKTSNVGLSNLLIENAILQTKFNSDCINYIAVIDDLTSFDVIVTPTAVNPKMKITVNGEAVASGTESEKIPHKDGETDITIIVTDENGKTKTYNVKLELKK